MRGIGGIYDPKFETIDELRKIKEAVEELSGRGDSTKTRAERFLAETLKDVVKTNVEMTKVLEKVSKSNLYIADVFERLLKRLEILEGGKG